MQNINAEGPILPVSKIQSEQHLGPESYSCTEHCALTIVSFTNLGKPTVFQTTCLIWGAKQKIMNVLKYSTILQWGWIEDAKEMQLTELVAAKDLHLQSAHRRFFWELCQGKEEKKKEKKGEREEKEVKTE